MKRNAIATLVKDLVLIAALGLFAFGLCRTDGTLSSGMEIFICIAIAGIPFGWRWASKIITAVSFKGIGIKLLIAVCLGCVALFVVALGDVIRAVTYLCVKFSNKKQPTNRPHALRRVAAVEK